MISKRVQGFTESVIREMTRVNNQHDGINLAQGMPNFPPPQELIEAAHRAIDGDFHQYAITWGTPRLRQAIAEKYRKFYGMDIDPDRNVTVCCGSTETMLATLLAVLNPGDEVIIFEPFYENYGPGCIIVAAPSPSTCRSSRPDFSFDPDRLRRAVTPRTRAIIFNSPNNPSGKVFSRAELQVIADLCIEHDLLAITDEIYEHILYDGLGAHPDRDAARHGRADHHHLRHLEVVLGHRLAGRLRRRQPRAVASASAGPTTSSPWARRTRCRRPRSRRSTCPTRTTSTCARATRRGAICSSGKVEEAGFMAFKPRGAYYILTDVAHFLKRVRLRRRPRVRHVPRQGDRRGDRAGLVLLRDHSELGRTKIRFCFPKTDDMLIEAGRRLQKLRR